MPIQDLTPQLRTRLNQVERAVGWFVFLATALLLFGFGYYIYHTAETKGWFVIKAPFYTYVKSSNGLHVGDPVVMMGFPVGQITRIHAMPPGDKHNVRVEFEVKDNYFRYIWTGGSLVKINSGLFGQSQFEITRGTNGPAICVTQPVIVFTNLAELRRKIVEHPGQWQLSQEVFDGNSNLLFHAYDELTEANLQVIAALNPESVYAYNNQEKDKSRVVACWHHHTHRYENFKKDSDDAYLRAEEATPISDQIQAMITQVQSALPGILALTNKLAVILDNTANVTSNLNTTVVAAQPMVTNFAAISGELRGPGALGLWVLGTNAPGQIESALTNVNTLLVNTDTNLNQITDEISTTLINVANITSNLNVQVHANSNMLAGISKTVMDADDLMQGLKRHWLLRSAFKTNAPAKKK